MHTKLLNGSGIVYLVTEYDEFNHWVYNNWTGQPTYVGVMAGAGVFLTLLQENACPYLLNDNRQVTGPWDKAVQWLVADCAPAAVAEGLTHFAHVVSPESLAAVSAEALRVGLGDLLKMRIFGDMGEAQAWLREAQQEVTTRL